MLPTTRYLTSFPDQSSCADLDQRLTALHERVGGFDSAIEQLRAQVQELADQTRLTQAAVTAAFNAGRQYEQNLHLPPVPEALVAACSMPPGGTHWVTLDVYGEEVNRKVTGGSDPAVIWSDVCNTVKTTSLSEPVNGPIPPSDRASQGSSRPGS